MVFTLQLFRVADITFSRVTAMFGNTPFNIEYHILIKILHLTLIKEYTAQKLQKEYPSNSWNERSFSEAA